MSLPHLANLTAAGHAAGRALIAGRARGADGWHAALQNAILAAGGEDRELLRITDEVYAEAWVLWTPEAIRSYCLSALTTVSEEAAVAFLQGLAAGVPPRNTDWNPHRPGPPR